MPSTRPRSSGQQPKDAYAARGKTLTSQVQRLRGWVGTDASRRPELVDALNALVAHRLDGHAYAAAGTDAQDAVRQSADLLTASGPIGPYTSATDAVRCGTALVQLAALQAGIGLVAAAGATLESWDGLRAQVVEAGTVVELGSDAGRHALVVAARVALAESEVAKANAYGDAARRVSGESPDPTGFGRVDLDRLVSDTRWAAGRTEQSLGFLHAAKETYEELAGARLAEPGRLSGPVAERLGEPLSGLFRDLADRLGAIGELDLALANRRLLVERLTSLATRSETFRAPLAGALTDLAADLVRADRPAEAFAAAQEAEAAAADRNLPAAARLLAGAVLARATLRADRRASAAPLRGLLATEGQAAGPEVVAFASVVLAETLRAEGLDEAATAAEAGTDAEASVVEARARGVVVRGDGPAGWAPLDPDQAFGAPLESAAAVDSAATPTWLEQERAEARRQESERASEARREAEEDAVEMDRAAEAGRVAAEEKAAAEEEARLRAEERRAAADVAEQAERKRRREERLQEHRAEVEERERAERAARREEIDARLADLDVAETPERDRLLVERAGLEEVEVQEAEEEVANRDADLSEALRQAQGAFSEPEPEPEPEVAEESGGADLSEALRQAQGTFSEDQGAVPGAEPDDLAQAEAASREARARGGRREVRAAAETLVAVLRLRYASEPSAYRSRLRSALEDLASARLRVGDLFGSRSAAKEARQLG